MNTFSHIPLTPDAAILGVFALFLVVSVLLGLDKLKFFALSVYVGLVLATSLGDVSYDFVSGHGLNFTPGKVKLVLFTLPILLLSFGGSKTRGRNKNLLLAMILGLLVAALIVTSALYLMDGDVAANILGNSTLATMLFKLRLVWLAAVPVVAIAGLFVKGDKKH